MVNELFDNSLTAAEAAEIEKHLDEARKADDKRRFSAAIATALENSAINGMKKIAGFSRKDVENFQRYKASGLKPTDTGIAATAYRAYRNELEKLIMAADSITGNQGSSLYASLQSNTRAGIRNIWNIIRNH